MAKSSLPKVISKANKEISTIIENDIQKESELLKSLVDQVLAANVEVKKKNNQRINDTRRKLQELDIEIDELNKSIDLVDRETVLEQLNEMIDAENKIFSARQDIRFFEQEHVGESLEQINNIYNQLTTSIARTKAMEDTFKAVLKDGNSLLFDKQLDVTTAIIDLMTTMYTEKNHTAKDQINQSNEIKERIKTIEDSYVNQLHLTIEDIAHLQEQSTSVFTEVDDDILVGEKITNDHETALAAIDEKIKAITATYEDKKNQIIDTYKEYEDTIRKQLESQNKQALEQEKKQRDAKDEQLKNIRLLIIDAEKKQDFNKVQSLMKQFDKIEKSNVAKVTSKTDKELTSQTKKAKDKAYKQLKQLDVKYASDINKQEFNRNLENIKFDEAKILYKIKSDYKALQGDLSINKDKVNRIQSFYKTKRELLHQLFDVKLELRLFELELMKSNEVQDNELVTNFSSFLQELTDVEQKRMLLLTDSVSNHEIIRIDQQYHIGKTVLDLRLSRQLHDIDQLILKTRNESIIKIEKVKEEANSEIIYQESLIKIAQKERELQLKKVHSLYENERSLAEEQVERINLGIQVNDAFVKTTMQNQLLFAEQQIKCAESEFNIRVENINLTKEQEIAYANKKIDQYRQKYEYEKSKIRKELDDKLEDLNYKLLLFTDKKENESIQEEINSIQETYDEMIAEIDAKEDKDAEIKRYEEVIDAATNRADQAINEASALKEQTVDAFEALYTQTRQKYELIEETDHSQDTVGLMPLLNSGAVNSADDRLQRAIKEAETLYDDRIRDPQEIINKTKAMLLEMTQDEETEAFIQEQKELKRQRIREHANELEQLHKNKEQAMTNLQQQVEQTKQAQQKQIQDQYKNTRQSPFYRDEATIEADYKALRLREKERHTRILTTIDLRIKDAQKRQKKLLKETSKWIKSALKPYKKYIRHASRTHRAKKKELVRKNKRLLKKAQSEAEQQFSITL